MPVIQRLFSTLVCAAAVLTVAALAPLALVWRALEPDER